MLITFVNMQKKANNIKIKKDFLSEEWIKDFHKKLAWFLEDSIEEKEDNE